MNAVLFDRSKIFSIKNVYKGETENVKLFMYGNKVVHEFDQNKQN